MSLLTLAACSGGGTDTGDTGGAHGTAGIDCEGVPELQAPAVVDAPTEWSCTVRIGGDIRVQDTLTIAPCTRILIGDRMYVNDGGRIVARGTSDCPISFTSPKGTPGPGDGRCINFEGGADNGNVFEHVILEYGGNEHGIVTAEDSVQEPRILGIMGCRGPIETDTTVSPQSVPYELSDVTFNADIRVAAGTIIQAQPGARFFTEEGGDLFLDGTAEAPVIWESAATSPGPGDWQEITIDNTAGTAWTFTHAILRHGGSDGQGVVYVETDNQITLDNVVFEDTATCDVDGGGDILGNSTFVVCD